MDPTLAQSGNPTASSPVALPVIAEHIGVKAGYCGGKPHILGHRVKVQHVVVWHERMGMSPTEIVVSHPTLSLADVHTALAYYYDHRDEIIAEEKFAAEIEAKYPSRHRETLKPSSEAVSVHVHGTMLTNAQRDQSYVGD